MGKDKKSRKTLGERVADAAKRSSMADTPYVNTASGWKVDSQGTVVPGDPENPEAEATRIAGLIGAGVGQGLVSGAALLRTYPAIARAVDVAGNIDGIRNLASGNGVRKTANLIKEHNYGKAALSALGDAFDLLGFWDTARLASRIADKTYRGYHTFNVLSPYSYDHPVQRGKEIAKSMLLEKTYDSPAWKDSQITKDYLASFHQERDRRIAEKVREDALAIYTGQPMRNNTYIKNADGTYSFNLDEIQKIGGDELVATNFTRNRKHDYIGHTHGGLWADRTHDVTVGSPLFGTDGLQYTHGNLRIEDLWDLQPFSRSDDALFGKRANKWLTDKLGSRVSDAIIEKLTNNSLTRKLDERARNFEAGKLLGGTPFHMRTDIPYTRVLDVSKFDPAFDMSTLVPGTDPLRALPGVREYYGYIDIPGYINPMKSEQIRNTVPLLHPAPESANIKLDKLIHYDYGGLINRYGADAIRKILDNKYKSGGRIHIKPSKKGTFTAAAKKHGKSVQAFASQVLAHKSNYSPAMVKKANFARNAAKWHADGGYLDRIVSTYGSIEAARSALAKIRANKS